VLAGFGSIYKAKYHPALEVGKHMLISIYPQTRCSAVTVRKVVCELWAAHRICYAGHGKPWRSGGCMGAWVHVSTETLEEYITHR
jgi:hypothetical protein